MNTTVVIWLLVFAVLSLLTLRRPSWGVSVYMLTFFLSPPFWWWGDVLAGYRWNLYGGLMLLGSTFMHGALGDPEFWHSKTTKRFLGIVALMAVNMTLVHLLLAPNMGISSTRYSLMMKLLFLFVLITAAIRDTTDLKIVAMSILIGALYIGYEVTINERGKLAGGRLEGIGVANASTANDLACLMVTTISLVAPFFLFGKFWEKAIAVVAGPLILNVILLCNSRGAFLALIILGVVYLFSSPAAVRPKVVRVLALGLVAGWMLLGDPRIVERFLTTFAGAEERDRSAASRIEFWRAGILMIKDHPLGAGGDAFKLVYGGRYIKQVTGSSTFRSVHQGYLNEASQWGIQGAFLHTFLLLSGARLAWRNSRLSNRRKDWFLTGINLSIVAGISGLLVQSLFGTFLDDEWGLWLVALAIGASRIVSQPDYVTQSEVDEPVIGVAVS